MQRLSIFCIGFASAYVVPPITPAKLARPITSLYATNNLSNSPHIRILKRGRHYDVQTSVTSFRKRGASSDGGNPTEVEIDLHSQIHFGDASYFDYYSQLESELHYDAVLYELLTSECMLKTNPGSKLRSLKPLDGNNMNPIQPTRHDRNTASQYGLTCQVDGIHYCRDKWIHADLTREEFLAALNEGQTQHQERRAETPLWALASTSPTSTLQEGLSSLLNPPSISSSSNALSRRLFSHLFLPGSSFAILLRSLLWIVPSPELSILLVDWSTITSKTSDIAIPVLLSLISGRWGTARRLVFGQVLVGGSGEKDGSKNGVLIEKRNERALNVLKTVQGEGGKRIALLYGAGHCQDMTRCLVNEGYVPTKKEWRTAFRATPPNLGDFYLDVKDWKKQRSVSVSASWPKEGRDILQSMDASTLESVAVSLVILPLYLLLGGFDWVATLSEVGSAFDSGSSVDGLAAMFVYLVRHVALYVAISKFVVDWGGKGMVLLDEESD
jgi:hypothetical protein